MNIFLILLAYPLKIGFTHRFSAFKLTGKDSHRAFHQENNTLDKSTLASPRHLIHQKPRQQWQNLARLTLTHLCQGLSLSLTYCESKGRQTWVFSARLQRNKMPAWIEQGKIASSSVSRHRKLAGKGDHCDHRQAPHVEMRPFQDSTKRQWHSTWTHHDREAEYPKGISGGVWGSWVPAIWTRLRSIQWKGGETLGSPRRSCLD